MTSVAIHQPNFFPWVGYFEKIAKSDYFVFLDDVQYTKGALINRVTIDANNGTQYITAPVNAPFGTKIKNVDIAHKRWKPKALRTLMWEYGSARFYNESIASISHLLAYDEKNLSRYNIHNIIQFCSFLGIQPRKGFLIQSELDIPGERESTELLIDIIGYLGCKDYYSGVGALAYLDEEKMFDAGINVTYQNIRRFPTSSIIDVLFKYGKCGVMGFLL